MTTVTATLNWVEVDVDISDIDTDDLEEELESRGKHKPLDGLELTEQDRRVLMEALEASGLKDGNWRLYNTINCQEF